MLKNADALVTFSESDFPPLQLRAKGAGARHDHQAGHGVQAG